MIKVLTGLPDGVIGFETEGEVHAEDWEMKRFALADRDAAATWAAGQ